jgi:hypothetical protein
VQLQTLVDLVPRFGKQASSAAIPPPDLLIVYLVCPFFSYALVFVNPLQSMPALLLEFFCWNGARCLEYSLFNGLYPRHPAKQAFTKGWIQAHYDQFALVR